MPPKKKGPMDEPTLKPHAAPKRKEAAPPSRDERSVALKEWFNKKMKNKDGSYRAQLKSASEYALPWTYKRLPTGLLSLDTELRGGFPAGGVSQIIGYRNTGKTWLYWQIIRQLQSFLGKKMKVLLAMTEGRADRTQGRASGVVVAFNKEEVERLDRGRIHLGRPPFTPEQRKWLLAEIGQIDELHGMAGEDIYDGILAAVEEDVYHLVVIDSIGMIMSAAEAESESVHDKVYSGSAGVNTQFLHKLSGLLTLDNEYGKPRETCVIVINQMRDNVKDPNKEYKNSGGNALEHAKLVDLLFRPGSQLGENKLLDGKQTWVSHGKEVNWEIKKGKAGMHEGGKGHFTYDFRIKAFESIPGYDPSLESIFMPGTADFTADTVASGVYHGVIEQSGAWFGIPNPEKSGTYLLRAQGKEAFARALFEEAVQQAALGNESLFGYIRDQVNMKTGINLDYNWIDP